MMPPSNCKDYQKSTKLEEVKEPVHQSRISSFKR